MGDGTRLFIRLGLITVAIIGGIYMIVRLQRVVASLNRLRQESLTAMEQITEPALTYDGHGDVLLESASLFNFNEMSTGFYPNIKWTQCVL